MAEKCEICFEKDTYRPGESINGKVNCSFLNPITVRDIKITFFGRAKVFWKQGKISNYDRREYFAMECNLLLCETKFEPGNYYYPFTFNLPGSLPSSMKTQYGSVKYKAEAVVDIAWAIDCKDKKIFTVFSPHYLSLMDGVNSPIECTKEKIPFSFGVDNPIKLTVNLEKDCYAPNQMVLFIAKIKNDSSVTVNELSFQIIQAFSFHVKDRQKEIVGSSSEEFAVVDSVVKQGDEKYWNLELRIPADMFIGTLPNCETIKISWKLKGVVSLPFPHRNMVIEVPLLLGSENSPRVFL